MPNLDEELAVIWRLDEAVDVVRRVETVVATCGAHAALAGGVMKHGFSSKDLDVVIYPHKRPKPVNTTLVRERLASEGFTNWSLCPHEYRGDTKEVWSADCNGKRVDFIFTL